MTFVQATNIIQDSNMNEDSNNDFFKIALANNTVIL